LLYTPGVNQDERNGEYREAYAAWQKQLEDLHAVFLEGRRLDPVRLKGLLNRESRAKRRYDRARLRLLGIEEEDEPSEGDAEEDA
jgi:hypothetical protein